LILHSLTLRNRDHYRYQRHAERLRKQTNTEIQTLEAELRLYELRLHAVLLEPRSDLAAALRSDDMVEIKDQSREAASLPYSPFPADLGVVISVIAVLFASMSAAHKAAPTSKCQRL